MKRFVIGLALASITVASPAHAVRYAIDAFGALSLSPSPNPIPGFTFTPGVTVIGHWEIDFGKSAKVDIAPVGGTGQARLFTETVTKGALAITCCGATQAAFLQNASSGGAVVVLNDASPAPNLPALRLDQVTVSDGARFIPGFTPTYDLALGLAPEIFLRTLTFGKSAVGPVNAPPTLTISVEEPDFAGMLRSGGPYIFSFSLAQGKPANQAAVAGLPTTFLSVFNPTVFVTEIAAVPEPDRWAMMLAGFALAGAALRRQRPTGAAEGAV